MVYPKFNENKAQNTFDNMFGKGAFNSGMAQAREVGRTTAQAKYEKDAYAQRIRDAQSAAKKAEKAAKNKTYDDALAHWQQNKDNPMTFNAIKGKDGKPITASAKNQGADRTANEIRNNPNLQSQIKAQGFKVNEYIDALYNVTSGGKFRTEREYKQFAGGLKKDVAAKKKDGNSTDALINQYGGNNQNTSAASQNTNKGGNGGGLSGLFGGLGNAAKKTGDFLASKDVNKDGQRDGLLGLLDRYVTPISKGATDSFFPGNTERMAQNNKDKYGKVTNPVIKAAQKDRGLETKLLNGIGVLGAAAVPYSKAYKVADLAVNKLPKLAKIANPYVQKAIKGGLAGGLAESGISATNELFNSEANNMKDYALRTGLGVAGGAILDPAFYGAGQALKGASQNTMKKLLPSNNLLSKSFADVLGPNRQKLLNAPQTALPAPRETPAFNDVFRQPSGPNSPIPSMPDAMKAPLNFGRLNKANVGFGYNTKNAPKARFDLSIKEPPVDPMKRGQQYWQGRYEDFAKTVNKSYDMNRMTQEGLDQAWSQFAKYDEPVSLNQVVDLAYPKGFEAPPVPKAPQPEPPLKQALRADQKINDAVQGLFPPLSPKPKVSRLATMDEIVQNMQRLAPPKQEAPKLEPLQFKRTIQQPSLQDALKNSLNPAKRVNPKLIENAKAEAIKPMPLGNGKLFDTLNTGELQKIKDITDFQVGTKNLYQLAERLPKPQRDRITTTLDAAKKAHIDTQTQLTNDLYTNVVKGLEINKNTKESALVQDFGEKTLAKKFLKKQGIDYKTLSKEQLDAVNLQELQKQYPDKWGNIVQADNYFRTQYDQLIKRVNEVRASIYPGQKDKLVPRRGDYYHHFNDLTGFEGIKNMFETPSNIDPSLEGISPYTKPKTKWQGFMQKRLDGSYKSDAVGGFLKYIKASSHSINIDPVIPVVRKTANDIAEATGQTRNANKIVEALNDHANDLAGKTNPYDRLLQKLLGRGIKYQGVNALNSRVKSNMIVGNLSSALGQAGNVPLGIGKAKQYSAPGLADTLTQTANQVLSKTKLVEKDLSAPIYKSEFIKERYADRLYTRFDRKLIDQPKKLALWMMDTVDKSSTSFIWNSMYHKGMAKGAKDAIKYADTETRNIVAGRGVGEVPLMQKSKTAQLLMPFTLEVGNQWTVLRKMAGEKDVAGLMTFLVASYGLNKAFEQIRGSGVSFDPAGAFQDGFTKKDGNTTDKLKNGTASVFGEVVGNIPGGNLLTNQVNTEKKVPFTDVKYKDLFGERNPNRFGTGLTVSKAISDPLYGALPWGAAQLRKTTQGLSAIRNKAVYKGDNNFNPFTTPKSELMYPVETNPLNKLKLGLMGPSSTSEARTYYDKKQKPMSAKNTDIFKAIQSNGGNANQFITDTRTKGKFNSLVKKLREVDKNKSLSEKEKQNQAKLLIKQLQDMKK